MAHVFDRHGLSAIVEELPSISSKDCDDIAKLGSAEYCLWIARLRIAAKFADTIWCLVFA